MIGINRCLPPLRFYSICVSPEIKFAAEGGCHFLKQIILKSAMFSLILCIIMHKNYAIMHKKTDSLSKRNLTPHSGVDGEDGEEKKRAAAFIPVNPVQFVSRGEKMLMITGRETPF